MQCFCRYDLHSGIHNTIGNHDDFATCVEYSDETRKQMIPPSFSNSYAEDLLVIKVMYFNKKKLITCYWLLGWLRGHTR